MGAAGFSWRQCSLPSVQGQAEYLKSQSPLQAFFNHLIFFFRPPKEETQLFVPSEVMSPQSTCQSRISSSSEQADPSKEPRNPNEIIEIPDTDDEEYDSDKLDNVPGQFSGTVFQSPARTPSRKLGLRNQMNTSHSDLNPVSLRQNQKRKRNFKDDSFKDENDGENARKRTNIPVSHLIRSAENATHNTNCNNHTLEEEQLRYCRKVAHILGDLLPHYTEDRKRDAQKLDEYSKKYADALHTVIETQEENARVWKKMSEIKEEKIELEKSGVEQHEKICELKVENAQIRRMYLEAEKGKIELEKKMNKMQETVDDPEWRMWKDVAKRLGHISAGNAR
ncbi:hypothetical protein DDE83_001110 [Stemphylium lycopersici]|uniref:Uncharacterized protein n=1 Tax=Stemphylium lycopersici TaxID=183478 RepID=A0A364NDU7_STELY|nr:hypothetical protein DDE83_001110 [Stemphylium lycopersici]